MQEAACSCVVWDNKAGGGGVVRGGGSFSANWAAKVARLALSGRCSRAVLSSCCCYFGRQTDCSRKSESRLQKTGRLGGCHVQAGAGRERNCTTSLHRGYCCLLQWDGQANAKVTAVQLLLSRGQRGGNGWNGHVFVCLLACHSSTIVDADGHLLRDFEERRKWKHRRWLETVRFNAYLACTSGLPMHLG